MQTAPKAELKKQVVNVFEYDAADTYVCVNFMDSILANIYRTAQQVYSKEILKI